MQEASQAPQLAAQGVQKALTEGPGSASAAALWVLRPGYSEASGVRAAAALLKTAEELERPGNLFILVGLSPTLLEHSALAAEAQRGSVVPGDEPPRPSLLVQVAAYTHIDRLFGLRIVDAALEKLFERRWELLGDRILHGMEGLGFHDGEATVWDKQTPAESTGLWLMQQRYHYRRDAFFGLGAAQAKRSARDRARAEVIGRAPGVVSADGMRAAGEPTERSAIEAHLANAAPYSGGLKPHWQAMREAGFQGLTRRGFPFRHDGVEGMLVLAAAASPDELLRALQVFNRQDRLAEYVDGAPARLFFCPHDAASLLPAEEQSALAPLPLPPSAEVLEHGPDLVDYMVTVADLTYMHEFALGHGALYPPPLYEQARPDIRALFRQMHEVLAAGDPKVRAQLEELLDTFQRASVVLNRMVGQYVTKA